MSFCWRILQNLDEKCRKRFDSYKKSLASLAEARGRDMRDSFVLSGTSAKFSITFDLAWKVMKDILVQHYAIIDFVAGSPREVLRAAFRAKLIDDEIWMEMLKVSNQLAHDYDGQMVEKDCEDIVKVYIGRLEDFRDVAEAVLADAAQDDF